MRFIPNHGRLWISLSKLALSASSQLLRSYVKFVLVYLMIYMFLACIKCADMSLSCVLKILNILPVKYVSGKIVIIFVYVH